jgi:iron complex outermembrane receptor protein
MAVALGCGATPALAKQAQTTPGQLPPTKPDDDAKDENQTDILVTGSRIVRPNIGSPSPIFSITPEDIKRQGAINVSDVLNRLPQIQPDNQATYQDSNGAQRVQLRGLGFNRTLSLIDGQRIATSEGVNVNAVPVALLERVDILTGGAASIYGADAVAGVINFIIKKDYDGLQLNASSSGYMHDNNGKNLGARTAASAGVAMPNGQRFDGGTVDVSAAWGHRFFDDRLSLSIYGGYTKTNPVLVEDRDFSTCYLTQNGQKNTSPICRTVTGKTPFGTFIPTSGANAGVAFSDAKDGSRRFVLNDPSFNYQFVQGNYLLQPYERYTAGGFLNFAISDHLALAGSYMMSDSISYVRHGSLYSGSSGFSGDVVINCNNPLLSSQQQGAICGAAAGTSATAPLNVQYVPGATFQDKYKNLNQRFTAALRGNFLDRALKFDANFLFSSFKNTQYSAPNNTTPNFARVQNSLLVGGTAGSPVCLSGAAGCAPADIFQLNGLSQAALNYWYGSVAGQNSNEGKLYDVTGNVQMDLGKFGVTSPVAKDGLAIAGGIEYRRDVQKNRVDAVFLTQKDGGNFDRAQDVKEGYVETNIPLIQDNLYTHLLSTTGSYRWSKYSSSPKTFTTWQIGGLYAPVSDVTFRVSYNKASRQPTLYELDRPTFSFVRGSGDPCATTPGKPATLTTPAQPGIPPSATAAQCANTGVMAAQYGNILQCADNSCLARSGGGQVRPETAHTLTYGIVLKPRFIPRLTFSVDRFDIQVDDQISYSYDSSFMDGCLRFGIPFFCDKIVRNPNGSLTSGSSYQPGTTPTTGFVVYGNFNAYKTIAKGYDFQGQYSAPIAPIKGALNFSFNGTLMTERGGKDDPTFAKSRNIVGYFGPFAGTPRPKWSHTLRTTYSSDSQIFSTSLNWRHIGGTKTTANSGDPLIGGVINNYNVLTRFNKIPAYDYFDLSASLKVTRRFTLSLAANNIFDKLPPIQPDSYDQYQSRANTIPQTYDPLGRFVQISATANF